MILLLNPNISASVTRDMVAIAQDCAPGLTVQGMTAPFGAPIISTPDALQQGAEAVAAMIGDLPLGTRAAISAAFGDPGLDAMRAALDIPVAGIGEASFLEAAQDDRPWAIATTTPALEDAIAARVTATGVARNYLGCRMTPGDPLALSFQPQALQDALAQAIERAVADGAAAVVIGGGPLAMAARALAPQFAVPIIEPIPAAIRLIRQRLDQAAAGSGA